VAGRVFSPSPNRRPEAAGPASRAGGWMQRGGEPLPAAVQASLERQLDVDLTAVRIHSGAESDAAARGMAADAFTLGPHIHFGAGRFDPGSAGGRSLLAHEVVHTLQAGAATSPAAEPVLGSPGSPAEQGAERAAAQVEGGAARVDTGLRGRAAGGSDGVIRRHVTHSGQGRIGSGEDFVTGQGATGRYTFTSHGGWLDRSHVLGHDVQAIEVMDRLAARQSPIRVTSSGSGGQYVTVYQIFYDAIPEPITDQQLEQMTIAIMMDHDRRFETFQRYSLSDVLAQTPFSYEDLPSDRVGVEIGLRYRRRIRTPQTSPRLATPVAEIDRPDTAQGRLRQQVTREVVNELGATSQTQGLNQYEAFLRQQGRTLDRSGGRLQLPDDYLHHSPENHSFAPYVDPALSPVTNPTPWLTDQNPPWVAGTFQFLRHEHDSAILALSDVSRGIRTGIGNFLSRIFLVARARQNPVNWDQSANTMSADGRAALARFGARLWQAANARSGRADATPADDFLAAMSRTVGSVVPREEIVALAAHMSVPTRGGLQVTITPELLANQRVMDVPEFLTTWRYIRYRVDPERLADFYLSARPE
jgi:hypothetical protein